MSAVTDGDGAFARICAAIVEDRVAIEPQFFPAPVVRALAAEARRRDGAGEFRPARIGRGKERIERPDIRGDRTAWLRESSDVPAEITLRAALESLRLALNQELLLGLFSFEGHYAIYPPGAFYRRHRDRFRHNDARSLSCILYLNEFWKLADGGALRIHLEGDVKRDVLPIGGTLVCFLADRHEHEVLPASRDRLAISGWFCRRKPETEPVPSGSVSV